MQNVAFFLVGRSNLSKARFFHSKENFKDYFIFFRTILTRSKYDFVENVKSFFFNIKMLMSLQSSDTQIISRAQHESVFFDISPT